MDLVSSSSGAAAVVVLNGKAPHGIPILTMYMNVWVCAINLYLVRIAMHALNV